MKNSKFKLALNEIEWALDIYPGHKVSIDIRDNILRIIDEKNPIQLSIISEDLKIKQRLRSTYELNG